MSHQLYDVTAFQIEELYTLRVWFSDNSVQVVDLAPVLYGEVYGPLQDEHLFRQVRLDPETKTLVWPNGADFDPYVLHEWPRAVHGLSQRLLDAATA
jgi:hypothetical protein